MINLLALLWTTGAALGSFLSGNTRAVQAHTSLDKAQDGAKSGFEIARFGRGGG